MPNSAICQSGTAPLTCNPLNSFSTGPVWLVSGTPYQHLPCVDNTGTCGSIQTHPLTYSNATSWVPATVAMHYPVTCPAHLDPAEPFLVCILFTVSLLLGYVLGRARGA
jgi:hypothetical protein